MFSTAPRGADWRHDRPAGTLGRRVHRRQLRADVDRYRRPTLGTCVCVAPATGSKWLGPTASVPRVSTMTRVIMTINAQLGGASTVNRASANVHQWVNPASVRTRAGTFRWHSCWRQRLAAARQFDGQLPGVQFGTMAVRFGSGAGSVVYGMNVSSQREAVVRRRATALLQGAAVRVSLRDAGSRSGADARHRPVPRRSPMMLSAPSKCLPCGDFTERPLRIGASCEESRRSFEKAGVVTLAI